MALGAGQLGLHRHVLFSLNKRMDFKERNPKLVKRIQVKRPKFLLPTDPLKGIYIYIYIFSSFCVGWANG